WQSCATPPGSGRCRRVPPARGPAGGSKLLASLRIQKLHVQRRPQGDPGGPWRPMEPRSPLARGLETQPRGEGSRPLQAAGPGLPDSHPADKVLRALELGLDTADELPERWLGHHEFDLPSDLPAG
ncbi:CITE1 protein, partial [Grantiella picta]|nr:CITE1 protein [Grantiella picta]